MSHVKAVRDVFVKQMNISQVAYLGDRETQEDSSSYALLNSGEELVCVLSDGMGGHAAGEVASKIAVETFLDVFKSYPSANISSRLSASLQQANASIASYIDKQPNLRGMGCTVVATHISKKGIQWVSVGDSLIYLYRSGKLTRVNADHSMTPIIQESLRQGKITKAEAASHPHRHALRSAVMGEDLPLIDISESPLKLFAGDIILLASDGLLSLTHGEILSVIRANSNNAQRMNEALIGAVINKNQPKQDNTTVQSIIIPKELAPAKPRFLGLALIFIFLMVILLGAFLFYGRIDLISHTSIKSETPIAIQVPDSQNTQVPSSNPNSEIDKVELNPKEEKEKNIRNGSKTHSQKNEAEKRLKKDQEVNKSKNPDALESGKNILTPESPKPEPAPPVTDKKPVPLSTNDKKDGAAEVEKQQEKTVK